MKTFIILQSSVSILPLIFKQSRPNNFQHKRINLGEIRPLQCAFIISSFHTFQALNFYCTVTINWSFPKKKLFLRSKRKITITIGNNQNQSCKQGRKVRKYYFAFTSLVAFIQRLSKVQHFKKLILTQLKRALCKPWTKKNNPILAW